MDDRKDGMVRKLGDPVIREQQAFASKPFQALSRARKVLAVICLLLWLVPSGIGMAFETKTVSSHIVVGGMLAGILILPKLNIKTSSPQ